MQKDKQPQLLCSGTGPDEVFLPPPTKHTDTDTQHSQQIYADNTEHLISLDIDPPIDAPTTTSDPEPSPLLATPAPITAHITLPTNSTPFTAPAITHTVGRRQVLDTLPRACSATSLEMKTN